VVWGGSCCVDCWCGGFEGLCVCMFGVFFSRVVIGAFLFLWTFGFGVVRVFFFCIRFEVFVFVFGGCVCVLSGLGCFVVFRLVWVVSVVLCLF